MVSSPEPTPPGPTFQHYPWQGAGPVYLRVEVSNWWEQISFSRTLGGVGHIFCANANTWPTWGRFGSPVLTPLGCSPMFLPLGSALLCCPGEVEAALRIVPLGARSLTLSSRGMGPDLCCRIILLYSAKVCCFHWFNKELNGQ